MAARDPRRSIGLQHAAKSVRTIGAEIRSARLNAGISQRLLASRARISREHLCRIELGRLGNVDVRTTSILFALLGQRLSIKAYPLGEPLRDVAQLRLLERFDRRVAQSWTRRREVPMPIAGDNRAWDEVLSGPVTIGVEAETRPRDLQATLRTLALKKRDGRVDRVALLLASTAHNEALVREHIVSLRQQFPLGTRAFLAAVAAGRDPGADALVLL